MTWASVIMWVGLATLYSIRIIQVRHHGELIVNVSYDNLCIILFKPIIFRIKRYHRHVGEEVATTSLPTELLFLVSEPHDK